MTNNAYKSPDDIRDSLGPVIRSTVDYEDVTVTGGHTWDNNLNRYMLTSISVNGNEVTQALTRRIVFSDLHLNAAETALGMTLSDLVGIDQDTERLRLLGIVSHAFNISLRDMNLSSYKYNLACAFRKEWR